MSLTYTAELNDERPFDYLVALQRHHEAAAAAPADWMPWSHRETEARLGNGAAQSARRTRLRYGPGVPTDRQEIQARSPEGHSMRPLLDCRTSSNYAQGDVKKSFRNFT